MRKKQLLDLREDCIFEISSIESAIDALYGTYEDHDDPDFQEEMEDLMQQLAAQEWELDDIDTRLECYGEPNV